MVLSVTKRYPATYFKPIFVSFNGSNFDDYFLLNQCIENDWHFEATYSGKSILGLTSHFFTCWDLRKFLVGSLASCGKSFNVYPLKKEGEDMGFSHDEVQEQFDKGSEAWNAFLAEKEHKIMDYNRVDVLTLYSLTQAFYMCTQ